MTPAPLIGIPCRHDLSVNYGRKPVNAQSDTYLSAIGQAGGIPFLIPLKLDTPALRRLYNLADGILLSGGGDIDPVLLKQPPGPNLADVQPDRDAVELTFSRWAAADGKPLLAICRGIQIIAAAAGGTLCQDLPSQMPQAHLHNYPYNNGTGLPETKLVHDVQLAPSCHLSRIFDTQTLPVNSLHHQAVQRVPEPLAIVGRSSDGVVEAIELPGHPFYCGVQWHPEVLAAEHESARRLFRAFIAACGG